MPGSGVQGRNPAGGTSLAGAARRALGWVALSATPQGGRYCGPPAKRSLTGRDTVTPGPKATVASGAKNAMTWQVKLANLPRDGGAATVTRSGEDRGAMGTELVGWRQH